jgi:hypothetical protein
MQLVTLLVLEILNLFLLALDLFLLVFYFYGLALNFLFKLILLSYSWNHILFGLDKLFLDFTELRKGLLVVSWRWIQSKWLGFTLYGLLSKSALITIGWYWKNSHGFFDWDSDWTLILERRVPSVHILKGFNRWLSGIETRLCRVVDSCHCRGTLNHTMSRAYSPGNWGLS